MSRVSAREAAPASDPIYLDYNATTPVDPRVVDEMLPYLCRHFGNPSSSHAYGDEPRRAVSLARERVGRLLQADPDEVVFTGSGTESDLLAIYGVVRAQGRTPQHLITQQTEHPAILEACHSLERREGVRVTYLPVDSNGQVDPADLAAAMTTDTTLVSIMYANNETGTIQPIAELAAAARERGVLFHTDAAQAVGKVPVSAPALGVDLLTVAGHKMYAPKGVGALYVRRGVGLEPVIRGGGQERGLRSGTENVAAIVALGAAAAHAQEAGTTEETRLRELRDLLHVRLQGLLGGGVILNGHPQRRLPNTLNVSLVGAHGATVLGAACDVAASTGLACHADEPDPSPVLKAMGLAAERALAAVRLSVGRWTTSQQIEHAARSIADAVAHQQQDTATHAARPAHG
jgi:cysteine desulfurase